MTHKYWELYIFCLKCESWVFVESNKYYADIIKNKESLMVFFGENNVKIVKKMQVLNKI